MALRLAQFLLLTVFLLNGVLALSGVNRETARFADTPWAYEFDTWYLGISPMSH